MWLRIDSEIFSPTITALNMFIVCCCDTLLDCRDDNTWRQLKSEKVKTRLIWIKHVCDNIKYTAIKLISIVLLYSIVFILTTEEFLRKNIAVLVISFGVPVGAKIWLEDTKCPFPMFLDHNRILYESFGLQRSIEKVRFLHY